MAGPQEDIVELFHKYSDNGIMTIKHLSQFLVEVQGEENATEGDAQAIFDSLKHLHVFQRRGLHLDAFFRYLMGDLNPPLPPVGVYHDMKAPLAHYFMYTGHNSYLTGNQLSSNSSTQPIINALRRGAKVIELDLWANKKGDDVEVYHGWTMTSRVELIKCLEAIKENAFHVSEYPVIITFEDHLGPTLQRKVAKMVINVFGEMLYYGVDFREFPSPESLKRKILISTKPPTKSFDNLKEQENNEQKAKDSASTSIRISVNDIESHNKTEQDMQVKQTELDEEEEEDDHDEDEAAKSVDAEYTNLNAIHAVKQEGSLKNLLRFNYERAVRLSLSEQKLENAIKSNLGSNIVRFTRKNLLRVYPKGTRFLSSNYNPVIGWTHGAQMVAFNMQGCGNYLWVMQGMFRANGGCGYIKKPDILLKDDPNNKVFDPNTKTPVKKTLKVKVYMGDGWNLDFPRTYFDTLSPPDFFTKLEILGVPEDVKERETATKEDQWVPIWNEEFKFPLTVPDLAFLRIEVRDFDTTRRNDFGGQTCLPITEMRTGIRAVPLYSQKGDKYKHVKLLMRFSYH